MGKLTMLLIAANVAVFLLIFSMPESLREQAFAVLAFSAGNSFEVWRWMSNLFLHASASHLFFNMLGLYFFGKILESEVPGQWFMAIYFAAGFLGNFVFMFSSLSPVIGASGAMFGVMGAAMLLNPVRRVHLYVFPLPLGVVAVAFTAFEALVVYFQPAEFINRNVANISHVAGILTGAVFAFFHSPKQSMKGMLVLALSLGLLLILGPLFALVAGIGGVVLQTLDFIIGIALYNAASALGFLWV